MELNDKLELSRHALIDVVNYFSDECPNMLTFYNQFKPAPTAGVLTIRINVQDDCYPILEYNPNWIQKIYDQPNGKWLFIYVVYMEMLKYILHHTTRRQSAEHTACASMVVTNIRESRLVLNFLPREQRDSILAYLETVPCEHWLEKVIAPSPLHKDDLVLERVEAILMNNVLNPDYHSAPANGNDIENVELTQQAPSFMVPDEPEEEDKTEENTEEEPKEVVDYNEGCNGHNYDFAYVSNENHPLDDYFSARAKYENAFKWGENGVQDEAITQLYESCSSSGWGNSVSAEMLGRLKFANRRKPNVKAILAKIRGNLFHEATESTRMRRNRRQPDRMDLMGQRHLHKGSVCITYDCSGSMSDEEINQGLTLLNPCLAGAQVDYAFWDTHCTDPIRLKKEIHYNEELKNVICGGGTVPECVGEKIKKLHKHYDAVIYVTDCEWHWPHRGLPKDTMIVVISTRGRDSIKSLPGFVNYAFTMDELLGK